MVKRANLDKSRAEEKQASRDEDARRLAAGEVTAEQLTKENSFFNLDGGVKLLHTGRKELRVKGTDIKVKFMYDGKEMPVIGIESFNYPHKPEELK